MEMMDLDDSVALDPPELRRVKGMSREDIRRELIQRGITPVGIHAEDNMRLKHEFQREFDQAHKEYMLAKQRRADRFQEEEEKLREAQVALLEEKEEMVLIKKHPPLRLFLDLARKNKSGTEASFMACPSMARAISKILPGCTSLLALDLSNGDLGDNGSRALARALENPETHLQRLDLNSCGIGPVGCQAIGNALMLNQNLATLSMEDNNLTADYSNMDGIKALAGSFITNTSLTNLNLNRTMLGAKGVASLAKAMQKNNDIVVLDIDFNGNAKIPDIELIVAKLVENKETRSLRSENERKEQAQARRQKKFEQNKARKERERIEYERQCDERAKQRQEERERKYKEECEARKIALEEGYRRAIERQKQWEEENAKSKKKKNAKKKK